MTHQVSGTHDHCTTIRVLALPHRLLSSVFGAGIRATTTSLGTGHVMA